MRRYGYIQPWWSRGTGVPASLDPSPSGRRPMVPHPWWPQRRRVLAAMALCPSGCRHASVALWFPIPGGREGHVSPRHLSHLLIDAETCLLPYRYTVLVATRDTCSQWHLIVPCPSRRGHASAALWLPIPGGHEGHMSARHWPRVLVTQTRMRFPMFSHPWWPQSTCPGGPGPVS